MAGLPPDHTSEISAALGEIVADYGPEALSRPAALANVLKDLLPDTPRIARLLVAAAEDDIAGTLRSYILQGLDVATAARLTASSFVAATMFPPEACAWVVREFGIALGLLTDGNGPPTVVVAPPPEPDLPSAFGLEQYPRTRAAPVITRTLADGAESSSRLQESATRQASHPAAHSEPTNARNHTNRVLAEAIESAQQISGTYPKALAMSAIATLLSTTSRDSAKKLINDAENIARSLTNDREKAPVLASLAKALAATDPDRALRLAWSITDRPWQVMALTNIAEEMVATDRGHAARLIRDAERVSRSITDQSGAASALAALAGAQATTDPDGAFLLLDEAKRHAELIRDGRDKAYVLCSIVTSRAAADPSRADPLIDEAERIAEGMMDESSKASVLCKIAAALEITDPNRAALLLDDAERISCSLGYDFLKEPLLTDLAEALALLDLDRALRHAWSITDDPMRVSALSKIAKRLSATDVNRAASLLDDAERVTQSMTDQYQRTLALRDIGEAWSSIDRPVRSP